MDKEKTKVLMELRPCLEGFAGIPQETRLVFHALNNLEKVNVTGLINHANRRLWPGLPRRNFLGGPKPHKKVHRLSRMAISVKLDPMELWWSKLLNHINKKVEMHTLAARALLRIPIPVYGFDASDFSDFIWQSLFSKTLSASNLGQIQAARFANMRPSHDSVMWVAIGKMRGFSMDVPVLDTKGYDVFLTQTPWPTNLSPRTQLVVRYHDAIPLFLPHTISNARFHQHSHMASLRISQRKGIFACTSSATRDDLLKVYPHLEKRAVVIPDIVSHEYFLETGNDGYISNIIRNHINTDTEPKFLTSREKENFYNKYLMNKPARFIMMVSTLEPRKNHSKLIAAWDYLKNHGMPDLKLVIVGTLGWDNDRIVDAMAPWQQRGELFHLQRVPSGQLRVLFNAAVAVVCPSVAEGFDLSGIEAMLCGGAVVASDIPVHREVYGSACEYFNPYSALDQAKAIEKVVHPDRRNRRDELVAAGLAHAPRYRRENIEHHWDELFERIRKGAFKRALGKARALSPREAEPVPALDKSLASLDESGFEVKQW